MECGREEQIHKIQELQAEVEKRKNKKDCDNEHADAAKIEKKAEEK